MMKIILSLAALAAVVIAFQNANAVEEPPEPRVQLVEVEQQTPYLESFNSITAGTATQSAIRRAGNAGGVVFSSQAYALFDNQNPDGSRATFPLEVEDGDTYGLRAQFVQRPGHGCRAGVGRRAPAGRADRPLRRRAAARADRCRWACSRSRRASTCSR